MRFLKLAFAGLCITTLVSACQTDGGTPKFGAGTGPFDEFAGCWSNEIEGVDDTFCFSRGSSTVTVSFRDTNGGVACSGQARARMGSSTLVIEQPMAIGGCGNGEDFVAQDFECDLTSSSNEAMLCINRFTAADGVDYEYPLVFSRS